MTSSEEPTTAAPSGLGPGAPVLTRPREPPPTGASPAAKGQRSRTTWQRAYGLLTSPKLAIALLVAVLACSLAGVTVVRGERAGELIFATLWFNGLLVLLAVSSAAAFFTRIWRRKLTLVSVGMIVFHLSFLGVLGGVVVNSLFSFRGVLRLTEGETLPNDQLESYDGVIHGRFFDPSRLRGETTLVRMHTGYRVGGEDKRAAYEIAVGEEDAKTRAVIYVTEYRDFDGVRYFCLKEGYSVLLVLSDKQGQDVFGAHVPLQSIPQTDGSRLYAAGTADEARIFPFPQPPERPLVELKVTYWPSFVERLGQVAIEARPVGGEGQAAVARKGIVPVGDRLDVGDWLLSPREIRYWVGMDVRYDPGLSLILGSLTLGLVGMAITLVGRLRQGAARKREAQGR